jgi:nitrogen fixation/metabolism regulation signal transduction histidine kinase
VNWLIAYLLIGAPLGLMSYAGMRNDNKSQVSSVLVGMLMMVGWLPMSIIAIIGLSFFKIIWKIFY